jgi:hypothetical protein
MGEEAEGSVTVVRASRHALWALLSMTEVIDGIRKSRHPEEAAKRSSRRACPREGGGRAVLLQPISNSFTRSPAGIHFRHGHRLSPV